MDSAMDANKPLRIYSRSVSAYNSLALRDSSVRLYFNKPKIRFINLTIKFLNRFCRVGSNDLGIVRNALFYVTVLSNNPYQIQI